MDNFKLEITIEDWERGQCLMERHCNRLENCVVSLAIRRKFGINVLRAITEATRCQIHWRDGTVDKYWGGENLTDIINGFDRDYPVEPEFFPYFIEFTKE